MSHILFWKGCKELAVEVNTGNSLPEDFVKLGSLKEHVFLLDTGGILWRGVVSGLKIVLSETTLKAHDFTLFSGCMYFASEGKVFKVRPDLEQCEEIILQEEASSCIHGHTTASHRVHVKAICGGGMGLLFVSDRGELWALGEHPQLDVYPDEGPKKVAFFEGRHVTLISSGDDFNVIVAHKRDDSCPTEGPGTSGQSEVFLSACPDCVNDNVISPLSPQSYSETCSLGLQLKKSNESLSASSSTSKNVEGQPKKSDIENSSSSTEGDSYEAAETTVLKLDNSSASAEEEKGDKVTMLGINTEAARQFLTRQLSWMSSGGEELLAEVSVPTRIRKNVSTITNLVYEGVKTVGDKVATLSRHMSGGSDNSSESFEEFEELYKSDASCASSQEVRWDWSCSEASEDVVSVKSGLCLARGARVVKSEVWSWGSSQCGQLGLGDTARRHTPGLVTSASHIGVVSVNCGAHHCVVQTLDGRCLAWGSNRVGQINGETQGCDQSSPLNCGRGKSVAAGKNCTILLSHDGNVIHLKEKSGFKCNLSGGRHILCSDDITCLILSRVGAEACADLAHEQCYLEELLTVHNSIVKPLSRKSSLDDTLAILCSRYTEILHITAGITLSLVNGSTISQVLAENLEELVSVYEKYLRSVCNVITINGFSLIARSIETPPKLMSSFSDRLPTRKTSSEAVLTCAFVHPLTHISVYKGMVSRGGGNGLERWESFLEIQESKKKEAETTKAFWETAGRLVDSLRTPNRRLVKDSKASALSLLNASRFSSHWFILLSDVFVHVAGANHTTHKLETLWVDSTPDNDSLQNALVVTLPEETLTLVAGTAHEKTEWLHAFQTSLKVHLNKSSVPTARSASYTFVKNPMYKDAKYTGRWLLGKLEGSGRLEWPDGRVYTGEFHNSLCHGFGRLEIPNTSIYEGQWKDGLQNGHGVTKYETGDVYTGYYKDGLENGHGVKKSGRFMSSQASVYVGEWVGGQKHGYGVINNIGTGEKYLGGWVNNMKNGSGLIVTLDGIYYEGSFVQDVLTVSLERLKLIFSETKIFQGHGVMVFEDGTHYEGELREAGVFSGKGTLTFSSGDTFEGSLFGAWNEGVKISGTLHKHLPSSSPRRVTPSKPNSFGQLCVAADQKWKGIFKQCWISLGASGEGKNAETQRAWESIAVILSGSRSTRHHELLQTIPEHNCSLTVEYYKQISAYLSQAFENIHHPLGRALSELVEAYTTTYGGVLVHPLLLSQAVAELHSITLRLYQIVRLLFPALPLPAANHQLYDWGSDLMGMTELLHPIILPKLYSSILVLYSLHNKSEDDTYWKRLYKWNRHPDMTLMAFLSIDKKFWLGEDGLIKREGLFSGAVETLQQLKTTFSPMEKLMVIRNTFEELTKAVQSDVGEDFKWTMDDLLPVFQYVVVRSHIQELGSEIHFIEDFMDSRLKNGELGIMFTTLKACFYQILQEKISISS